MFQNNKINLLIFDYLLKIKKNTVRDEKTHWDVKSLKILLLSDNITPLVLKLSLSIPYSYFSTYLFNAICKCNHLIHLIM